MSSISENFRMVAGLPKRENSKPTDPAKASELHIATEPEGGYGGEGGILNTSAINKSEHPGGQGSDQTGETGETSVVESGAPDAEGRGDETGVVDTDEKKPAAKKTAAKKKAD